jgi:ActR/RegA family two-component response regulator
MPAEGTTTDTILLVDDDESVRKTFQQWLEEADFPCQILTAADAESALKQANQTLIDLAILDWNLGAGNDGLQLLEDLYLFNPDVVAIMITGYAHQATPLDAMRMGVRDYLDKNQDLDRNTFLAAVRRQLERIGPAKRERRLNQGLVAFREAVEKVLPLMQSAAQINEPVPLPDAIRALFRFLLQITKASDGVFLARSYDADREPPEIFRVYAAGGEPMAVELVPFARSVAGSAISQQRPSVMNDLEQRESRETVEFQPFERGRRSLLAVPLDVAPGIQVVFELFDKAEKSGTRGEIGFTEEDQRLVGAAAELATEMLRQALGERQMRRVLLDGVAAALEAGNSLAETLRGTPAQRREQPPPPTIMNRLREGLEADPQNLVDAEQTLRLAEAIRVLALRHGAPAVQHCIRLVENLRSLLDNVTGTQSQ